jgi:hypothetical protein
MVRAELQEHHHALWRTLHLRPSADTVPPGLFGLLRSLENDVAAYVYRNDLRERVRGFVRQSLLHLVAREDVRAVVVNSHSQGTVLAFDVLKDPAIARSGKIRLFVTAGSPLRKYVDLFHWGTDAGATGGVEWLNFVDECDPVADQLEPPADWRRGDPLPTPMNKTLFEVLHSDGTISAVRIQDTPVDNVANSLGMDLRAHNYWDNAVDFVPALAKGISTAAAGS